MLFNASQIYFKTSSILSFLSSILPQICRVKDLMPKALDGSTICAISTAPGAGGIAVVRVSGPEALKVSSQIFSKELTQSNDRGVVFGRIIDPATDQIIDEYRIQVLCALQVLTPVKTQWSSTSTDLLSSKVKLSDCLSLPAVVTPALENLRNALSRHRLA